MIRAKATLEFTLDKFNELKKLERKDLNKNKKGTIYIGDVFECDKGMARYLLGDNDKKAIVIEVLEVIPEKAETKNELGNPIGTREIKTKKATKKKNKID